MGRTVTGLVIPRPLSVTTVAFCAVKLRETGSPGFATSTGLATQAVMDGPGVGTGGAGRTLMPMVELTWPNAFDAVSV